MRPYNLSSKLLELIFIDRFLIRRALKRMRHEVRGRVIDVGCGRGPYRDALPDMHSYIGIDRRDAALLHELTQYPYPLEEGEADWILCTQVIDDMPDRDTFVAELHRILADGGSLILSASFVWELHDLPNDYCRLTPEGLRYLLEKHGFEPTLLKSLGNSWVTLGQVININLLNMLERRSWWMKLISPILLANTMFFWLLGTLLNFRRFDNLPLATFLVARKKQPPQPR